MEKQIADAIKLLNENNYIVLDISKGQMCLCNNCSLNDEECRYNSIGHACSNLICINEHIKKQIDYKSVIESIK